jgi:hypothetical protein
MNVTTVFSAVIVALGLAIIARTIAAGVGGGLGLLLGGVLVLAGAARFYFGTRS